ncbi:MAG: ribonuclease HI [Desulfovibrionaceae bacterium]|jgi:ribonuclease HI|nr:ribonuclease HI [Desulfovibrionaceae bacterium]
MDEAVIIYTDGSCLGNPGPGGWAAVLLSGDKRKELSAGYRRTTNNRMEVLAAIAALEELKRPCDVTLYTDSRYLRDAVEKKWLAGWVRNGWKTAAKKPVKNQDLWTRLMPLLKTHKVRFHWVEGHSGDVENERCDELARAEAARPGQPADPGA